jgi:phage/plasmid-like protein (TIGR03299 family)
MAHEIATTADGRAAMFYTGEPPWHGLGTRLDNPATAAEAITAAGLDFTVELTRLTTIDGIPVPQRVAVVRSDTQDVLGVVSPAYVPVQNRQAFGFLDAIAAEGGIRYHTAGALRRGERVWLLGKLPGEIRVKDSDDVTEKYLLLSNSHDGSSALRVYFTPVRVV